MVCSRRDLALAAAVNGVAALLLVVVTVGLRKDVLPATRKGFSCDDASIRYPLLPASVSSSMVMAVGVAANVAAIVAAELSRRAPSAKALVMVECRRMAAWWAHAAKNASLFLLGLCAAVLLSELGKVWSGVLRPNFLAACKPNVTCSDAHDHTFHVDYACSSSEEDEADARKAFPSGHAVIVSYFAVFFCYTVEHVAFPALLARPGLQLAAVSLAWITSLSRVTDHIHHASDVVAGLVLGGAVAVCCLRLVTAASNEEQEERRSHELKANDETQQNLELNL